MRNRLWLQRIVVILIACAAPLLTQRTALAADVAPLPTASTTLSADLTSLVQRMTTGTEAAETIELPAAEVVAALRQIADGSAYAAAQQGLPSTPSTLELDLARALADPTLQRVAHLLSTGLDLSQPVTLSLPADSPLATALLFPGRGLIGGIIESIGIAIGGAFGIVAIMALGITALAACAIALCVVAVIVLMAVATFAAAQLVISEIKQAIENGMAEDSAYLCVALPPPACYP